MLATCAWQWKGSCAGWRSNLTLDKRRVVEQMALMRHQRALRCRKPDNAASDCALHRVKSAGMIPDCVLDIASNEPSGSKIMQESDFHEVADEFINLANELSEDWAMPFLSAVFMYAAARYNVHFFYDTDGDKANVTNAIDYYCEQYRKMLLECMNELGTTPHAG
jgi:hypothetical protein